MPPPGRSLVTARLTKAEVPAGATWHHIFLDRFPNPLGYGFASSRFSDPRSTPVKRFGVYDIGGTFEVAFLETIIRDRKNGNPGTLVLHEADLLDYVHVAVTQVEPLGRVHLRAGKAITLTLRLCAVGLIHSRLR